MSLFQRLFATKSLEQLHKEMAEDEGRLRRVLGPVGLTSLGIGAIIGAGIFVMTGRVAADNAGPAVMISYVIAGLGCAFAAFCYAEFASMAPVAGSAYTYAYATLGELLAWIIGWDLILEYAMSAATVGSAWSEYFNEFLLNVTSLFMQKGWQVPEYLSYDPFSKAGAWFNLPAVAILLIVTAVLVIGIRESAISNTILVVIKLGVVLFVIAIGVGYISTQNWTGIPVEERKLSQQQSLPDAAEDYAKSEDAMLSAGEKLVRARLGESARHIVKVETQEKNGTKVDIVVPEKKSADTRQKELEAQAMALYMIRHAEEVSRQRVADNKESQEAASARIEHAKKLYAANLPKTKEDTTRAEAVITFAKEKVEKKESENWGLISELGINKELAKIDDKTRTTFTPYGFSGILLGAALVFFAFIGFDSISTHAEEAVKPQRDVPIGILASLAVCTVLYILVSGVITGMKPYPEIDTKAAIASAFRQRAEVEGGSPLLKASAVLIALGGLAGMTSVLLITFLSQARVFLAMARDGFMPPGIFGAVHSKFKTPHISTMLTGAIIAVVAAFTPIQDLEKMVNIGTLFAFVIVCAAVLILRVKRPDAQRPFRTPALFIVAPLGILVNLTMMAVLPKMTWYRLVAWLVIGLAIYFGYGYWNSALRKRQEFYKSA
jgi:amino acid transporter